MVYRSVLVSIVCMWVHFGHHIWRILWTRLSVESTCVNKLLMTELLLLNSTCLISVGVAIHLILRWQIVKWTLLELTAIVLLLHIHHSIVVVVLLVHKIVVIVYIVVVVILVIVIVVLVIILTLVVVELSYCA